MDRILEYSQYHEPQVRALVWSMISPGLVNESDLYSTCVSSKWCFELYESLRPFLKALDSDPTELIQWLEKYKSWRLGIRFEAYWAFAIQQLIRQGELLAYSDHIQVQTQLNPQRNPQLNKNTFKTTLGEIDFIYEDQSNQLHHLEVAVKFYLLKPGGVGFERLIGPNGGDWYERKLEHLFKKQLPLSEIPEAKQLIAEQFKRDVKQVDCRQQGMIKGMIFFPITGEGYLNENEKQRLNPGMQSGIWGTISNWYLSDPGELARWVVLDKLDWLVPQIYSATDLKRDDKIYTMKEMKYKLKSHFYSSRRSLLIAQMNYDQSSGLWLEQQRVMVVDKYWPVFKRSLDAMFQQAEERTREQGLKKL